MSRRSHPNKILQSIDRGRLEETYDTIYNLQERLGISDDYLLNTTRGTVQDKDNEGRLRTLLSASILARDNLTTWYLLTSKVELNVTISLLTAKIKFVEFKLAERDGLDLHQACSLSLVDFCNILSDMTVTDKDDKKTMHMVSKEVGIPVWLSNYRNQICHVPSEGPSISILVPLVVKSLDYLRDFFWARVFEVATLDEQDLRNLVMFILSQTDFISVNQDIHLKKQVSCSKRRIKTMEEETTKLKRACIRVRKMLRHHPSQAMNIVIDLLVEHEPKVGDRNVGLVFEQILLNGQIEFFISNLIRRVQERRAKMKTILWLRSALSMVNLSKKKRLKQLIREHGICPSNKIVRSVDLPAVKCCQIAYKLARTDSSHSRGFILRLRYKLAQTIGKDRVELLANLMKVALSKPESV